MTPECCPCPHPMVWYELVAVAVALLGPVFAWCVLQVWKTRIQRRLSAEQAPTVDGAKR